MGNLFRSLVVIWHRVILKKIAACPIGASRKEPLIFSEVRLSLE